MQITVTIPDELAAKAQARGLELERYLPALLAEDLAVERERRPVPRRSAPEATDSLRDLRKEVEETRNGAVDVMVQFAEKHGFTTGGQDLKSMVHEGHKY